MGKIIKAWNYYKSIETINSLSTDIENFPTTLYNMKFNLAKELYEAKENLKRNTQHTWEDYLEAVKIPIRVAKTIVQYYDVSENRLLSERELKIKRWQKQVIGIKKIDKKKIAKIDENLSPKALKLLQAYSLNIFKDRDAGRNYYKSKIVRNLKNYLERLTPDEIYDDSREIVLVMKKIVDDKLYKPLKNNKK